MVACLVAGLLAFHSGVRLTRASALIERLETIDGRTDRLLSIRDDDRVPQAISDNCYQVYLMLLEGKTGEASATLASTMAVAHGTFRKTAARTVALVLVTVIAGVFAGVLFNRRWYDRQARVQEPAAQDEGVLAVIMLEVSELSSRIDELQKGMIALGLAELNQSLAELREDCDDAGSPERALLEDIARMHRVLDQVSRGVAVLKEVRSTPHPGKDEVTRESDGESLRAARIALGLTQEALAELLEIDQPTVSMMERDQIKPNSRAREWLDSVAKGQSKARDTRVV
jgi:DNA-binding transcriptional regulator YiaG